MPRKINRETGRYVTPVAAPAPSMDARVRAALVDPLAYLAEVRAFAEDTDAKMKALLGK